MSMKVQYLNDINHPDGIPFENDELFLARIKAIYGTARVGGLNNQVAINLRDYLINIYRDNSQLPITSEDYINFIKEKIKDVSRKITQDDNLRFGIAQKIVNLFMKDLWASDILTEEQEKLLHFPLDRIILKLLRESPWVAWTKVYSTEAEFDNVFNTYLSIQAILRNQMQNFIYTTPLELEQYLWHRFQ